MKEQKQVLMMHEKLGNQSYNSKAWPERIISMEIKEERRPKQ